MPYRYPTANDLSAEERADVAAIFMACNLMVDDDGTVLRVHEVLERVRTRARGAGNQDT